MFSTDAWARNAAIYEATRTHPFNRDLAAGTLRMPAFRHYMIQDAHYLVAFAQALAVAAAKSDDPDHIVQFSGAASVAMEVERSLHTDYFRRFGVTDAEVAATPPTPVAHHYLSFLIASGFREPLAVHLAAMLPCFWIYREIGNDIHASAAADNPYRSWIDTYAGEDFSQAVDAMIAVTDALAAQVGPKVLAGMHASFTRACQLEWMFWDSAYREAGWPV
ncbi:thiaminase II [Methylobacterium sp. C25]|uniref:thiaminase II n=1 Tax=Methylobacterium sp. C25 TaxID=2721622 RepID=UPI001F225BF5|nr:thiaminase II [Methylobacterium sp. C25]MCE4223658.1 thiaminase II [Methylobacterium sp. C25]